MREGRTMLRLAAVALLLVAFGAARLPWEARLTREHQAASFSTVKLNLGLRAKIGQLGFLAALSGFRTLVADLLWIDANTAWQRVEYGRMNLMFQTVTTLAPHNVDFWEQSAWHMAYNASNYARDNPNQPKKAIRDKEQHAYFLLGIDYLEQGIVNNPRAYLLYQNLGTIYRDKLHDHYNASLAFDQAKDAPQAPAYEKRFAAYELSQTPGHELQAWIRLFALYAMGPQERLPTLEKHLREMEEKLQLPPELRVYKTP